jgi:hypothetical protein
VEQYSSREFKVNILTARGVATAIKVKELEKIITSNSLLE